MLVHSRSGRSFAFLGPEEVADVARSDTTVGDHGRAHQLVELLVIADGELQVSGRDGLLLVLIGALSRQIKDLHREVLQGCGHEDTASDAHRLSVASLPDHPGAAANWEDEAGLAGVAATLGGSLSLAAFFAFSCHFLVQSQWGLEVVAKFKINRFKSAFGVFNAA